MPRLLAACVVHALRPDSGAEGVTGIDKRPVSGAVRVGRYGLRGDVQASRKHHGGLQQALYAYAQEDAEFWEAELGRSLPPGWFGENLRVKGLDLATARVGDVWRIGDRVEAQVTSPRTPCATFARWVGGKDERGWVRRFGAERRLGVYLSVRRVGEIAAGDGIVPESAPVEAPTALSLWGGGAD
ncbi:MOSC domain-containing protein [Microbacterium sp. NPDC091313]